MRNESDFNIPISYPPDLFSYELTYCKAGWVYHMLRTMLGDSTFFPVFRNMLHHFSYQSLETDDFKNYFKANIPNPPVSFDKFFDQWVYKAGHPIYELSSVSRIASDSNYNVTVSVNQIQNNPEVIPDVFELPLTLIFFGPDSVKRFETFINNKRNQTVTFRLPFVPDSVSIDSTKFLCQLVTTTVSVREISQESLITSIVVPNPIVSGTDAKIITQIDKRNNVLVDIYDEIGNKYESVYEGELPQGKFEFSFSSKNLPSGVYLVRQTIGNEFYVNKFSVVK